MKSVWNGIGWIARGPRRIAGSVYSRRQRTEVVGLVRPHEYQTCDLCEGTRLEGLEHCSECGVLKEKHR